jgi:hypothetical protein
MLSDHFGILFYPHILSYNAFGRIAMPLFAFFIAEGFRKSSNVHVYVYRLLLVGCISQFPYHVFRETVGLSTDVLNILFTLGMGLLFLILHKEKKYFYLIATLISFALFNQYFIHFEYGWYGIISIVSFYLFLEGKRFLGVALFTIAMIAKSMEYSVDDLGVQIVAILALVPIFFYNGKRGTYISRLWWYAVYPAHFIILLLMYKLLGFSLPI